MSTDQALTPELDSGTIPLGARIRRILAAPARLIGVLVVPDRVMPKLVREERSVAAIVALILCGLFSAWVIGKRIDMTAAVFQQDLAAQKKAAADYEVKSDRELGEEIVKQRTIQQVELGLAAGLLNPVLVLLLGMGVFVVGRYVGGRPSFGGALAASAGSALPIAVKSLVVGLMAWPSKILTPPDVAALRNVAVFSAGKLQFLRLDAFLLWSVILLVFGLAAAAHMSRKRALTTVVVCFALFQLLTSGGTR